MTFLYNFRAKSVIMPKFNSNIKIPVRCSFCYPRILKFVISSKCSYCCCCCCYYYYYFFFFLLHPNALFAFFLRARNKYKRQLCLDMKIRLCFSTLLKSNYLYMKTGREHGIVLFARDLCYITLIDS